MDEDIRTLWCGNLSDKVTEDILYELFLQGGPVQRVSIPKDRNGKQRTYGFITYKHVNSVSYALSLFDGTALFDRPLSMKTRNNIELPQQEKQDHNLNLMAQWSQQGVLGNFVPQVKLDTFGINALPGSITYPSQKDRYSHKEDRVSRRMHPYHREHERDERDHNREKHDQNLHKSKPSLQNRHSHKYSRHTNYKSSRRNYH